jgi:hypothetical protein
VKSYDSYTSAVRWRVRKSMSIKHNQTLGTSLGPRPIAEGDYESCTRAVMLSKSYGLHCRRTTGNVLKAKGGHTKY